MPNPKISSSSSLYRTTNSVSDTNPFPVTFVMEFSCIVKVIWSMNAPSSLPRLNGISINLPLPSDTKWLKYSNWNSWFSVFPHPSDLGFYFAPPISLGGSLRRLPQPRRPLTRPPCPRTPPRLYLQRLSRLHSLCISSLTNNLPYSYASFSVFCFKVGLQI